MLAGAQSQLHAVGSGGGVATRRGPAVVEQLVGRRHECATEARRQRLAVARRQLTVDHDGRHEHLHGRVRGRVGVVLQQDHAVPRSEAAGALLGQPEGVGVEAAVCIHIPHTQPHADLGDALVARRHQQQAVAVRVAQRLRPAQPLPRHHQLQVAAGRGDRQRRFVMIHLQHTAGDVVAVLVLPAPHGEDVVERRPTLALPERQHGHQPVRRQPDVDPRLRQFHPAIIACTAAPGRRRPTIWRWPTRKHR